MTRVLGIVPARGGSKGIPRKNLVPLAGRPLLAYTCAAVREARLLDRAIVSTEDDEIAAAAEALGLEAPFRRPAALARDEAPMLDVVRHALDELARRNYVPDTVVVLQPTSPLRRGHHIDAAVGLLHESNADTVVTVVRVPHQYTPGSLMRLDNGRVTAYEAASPVLRRQDKPVLFARNGPAVLVARRTVIESGTLYGADVRLIEMDAAESVDIDTLDDLALAEFWIARHQVRPA